MSSLTSLLTFSSKGQRSDGRPHNMATPVRHSFLVFTSFVRDVVAVLRGDIPAGKPRTSMQPSAWTYVSYVVYYLKNTYRPTYYSHSALA